MYMEYKLGVENMKNTKEILESIKNNKCPNCESKRFNEVPGSQETNNKKTYYCISCGNEFDRLGRFLPPVF